MCHPVVIACTAERNVAGLVEAPTDITHPARAACTARGAELL